MPQFESTTEAFQWFLENVYPKLSSEQRRKFKDIKHDLATGRQKVSEKRMLRFMNQYAQVKHLIEVEEK